MGCFEQIKSFETHKYCSLYQHILIDSDLKKILEKTPVYLISTDSIPNFIKIIEESNIFKYKNDSNIKTFEIYENNLKKSFEDYRLERKIKIYNNYTLCKDLAGGNNENMNEFIIVDEKFLKIMSIENDLNDEVLIKWNKNRDRQIFLFKKAELNLDFESKRNGIYRFKLIDDEYKKENKKNEDISFDEDEGKNVIIKEKLKDDKDKDIINNNKNNHISNFENKKDKSEHSNKNEIYNNINQTFKANNQINNRDEKIDNQFYINKKNYNTKYIENKKNLINLNNNIINMENNMNSNNNMNNNNHFNNEKKEKNVEEAKNIMNNYNMNGNINNNIIDISKLNNYQNSNNLFMNNDMMCMNKMGMIDNNMMMGPNMNNNMMNNGNMNNINNINNINNMNNMSNNMIGNNNNFSDPDLDFLVYGCKISLDKLDPNLNCNFSTCIPRDTGPKNYLKSYKIPTGWKGYGLNVLIQYKDKDWLGHSNSPGEWYVGYHGTKTMGSVNGIIYQGFRRGNGQTHHNSINSNPLTNQRFPLCGIGVYFTPDIDEAKKYTESIEYNGYKYRVVFMCRINPYKARIHTFEPLNSLRDYFIVEGDELNDFQGNKRDDEVRPYRILLLRE